MVMLHTELLGVPRMRGFEIVRFSLRAQGDADAPLALYADRDVFHDGFWCDPELCGNYAAIVIFNKPSWMVFLVDWTADCYILVSVSQRPHISMIPDHLVLATYTSAHSIEVSVLAIESLRQYWRPIRNINWAAAISDAPLLSSLPTLFSESVTFAEHPPFRLSVYESPLVHRKFNIQVHVFQTPPTQKATTSSRFRRGTQPSAGALKVSFVLTLPRTSADRSTWRRRGNLPLSRPACFPDFDYAESHGEAPGVPGAPRAELVPLTVLASRIHVRRSVHSGALTLVVPFEIVTRYYW
ncbi:hypothetical protein B0H19DRAFT_1181053 [Mycena capillaripes]|nr:hypothetical protein B0H19DRAFT_1181053 [Mycena capillaripes]